MRVCSVSGCDREYLAKGFCRKHYQAQLYAKDSSALSSKKYRKANRDKSKAYNLEARKKRILQGLCVNCGHTPLSSISKRRCAACLEISRVRQSKLQRTYSKFLAYLKTSGCVDCGYVGETKKLHFHHTGVKEFTISTAYDKSIEVLQKEIMVTDLVCIWCHHKRHKERTTA